MTKWIITQDGSVVSEFTGEQYTYSFPINKENTDKKYVVTVTDNDGCTATTNVVVPSGDECKTCKKSSIEISYKTYDDYINVYINVNKCEDWNDLWGGTEDSSEIDLSYKYNISNSEYTYWIGSVGRREFCGENLEDYLDNNTVAGTCETVNDFYSFSINATSSFQVFLRPDDFCIPNNAKLLTDNWIKEIYPDTWLEIIKSSGVYICAGEEYRTVYNLEFYTIKDLIVTFELNLIPQKVRDIITITEV